MRYESQVLKPLYSARSAGARVVAIITCALGALAFAASPAVAADDESWGFEQVTPVTKGTGTVAYAGTFRPSEDGESLLYTTNSGFSSVPAESSPRDIRYVGHRGTNDWMNRPTDPPIDSGLLPVGGMVYGTMGSSSTLSHVTVASPNALTPGATQGGGNLYLRNTRTGELTLIATDEDPDMTQLLVNGQSGLAILYIAPDGGTVIFSAAPSLTPDAPDLDPTLEGTAIYKWTEGEGLESVSVLPESEGGATVAGLQDGGETGPRNQIDVGDSYDHVYFQTWPSLGIYVRTDNVTRPVSQSRIPDASTTPVRAKIDSVRANGRYMLFHTDSNNTRLTEDTPNIPGSSRYLYRYDYDSDSLTYIGHSTNANGMKPQQMSKDGRTVAFQSNAALTDDAVAGSMNLYAWRDGETRLMSTADAGSTQANETYWIRMLSENGDYFAYSDNSSSLAAQFGLDNVSSSCPTQIGAAGPCDQVYVYDIEADELECASCRTDGEKPDGRAGDPGTKNHSGMLMDRLAAQFVANDGSVFFTTSDPLVNKDANGALDVYAYHDGEVRLITRAAQGANYARFLNATADGKKIFIATNDPIAPTDTDKAVDIYMTGPDAGFDYVPPDITPPCEGSECRDAVAPLPDLPPAGSIDFQGNGNAKVVIKRQPKARGVVAKLRITVPARGQIKVSGKKVRNKIKRAADAGKYRINVRLNKRGKRQLENRNRIRVPIKVRFNPREGRSSSTRVGMTFKANSTKKGL